MLTLAHGAGRRLVPGALIALAHVLFFLALLHHTGARVDTGSTPADYIALAFIAAPTMPVQKASNALPPIVVPSGRTRRIPRPRDQQAPSELIAVSAMPQATASDARTETALAAMETLDMESLRGAARQVEKERGPSAMEPLRARDDTPVARALERAKRPDCQTKYAGGEKANLLLLIPLAIETITDKGCKW